MPKQRQNQVTDKMIEAFREWEEQTYGSVSKTLAMTEGVASWAKTMQLSVGEVVVRLSDAE